MHATPEGTARYRARHAPAVADDHFRACDGLAVSSVGLGTYLGPADDAGDARYEAAVRRALELGINVLDAAINYRHQRSERAVGRALAASGIARDEVVVATKGGFIPRGLDATALARPDEIVAGCHCIAPRWLEDQIERSRANLGVRAIDVYYLHNPETQLEEVSEPVFLARMRAAFEVLERACADGRIVRYGTATWDGYRVPGQLDLVALEGVAREVGGAGHRFRVLQLPLNPRMPEAADAPTQRGRTLLEVAAELGMYVMSSASILQGKLPAAEALRWTRTRRGLGTALVGMGRPEHVEANAAVFRR